MFLADVAQHRCKQTESDGPFLWTNFLEYAVLARQSPARVSALAGALRSRRDADGSWPSAPILRITDPNSHSPGDDRFQASRVVADDRRLFTTRTAVAALTAAKAHLRRSIAAGGGGNQTVCRGSSVRLRGISRGFPALLPQSPVAPSGRLFNSSRSHPAWPSVQKVGSVSRSRGSPK